MSAFAIGVDLGGTNLRIAALNSEGKLLEKITTGTEVARGRGCVIQEMCDAIRQLAAKFPERLLGTGIGVPGIIDMATGTVVRSPNLPDWRDYRVRAEIEQQLRTPVILENDANAAAFGEKWLGAARDVASMCMFTLGTGVGGGLVLDGRIWHGMNGMAAELGHITVDPGPEAPHCGCGNRGCVEQFASATAIKRMAIEAIATGEAPELARAMKEDPEFSARVVFQMASQGDKAAQRIFELVGRSLGIVIASVINIFNLPMIVIGGGVASGWEAFAPAMFQEVRKRSYIYLATEPDPKLPRKQATLITRALLGSDAGLYGAARLPMLEREVAEHQSHRRPA
jgi:glucokinase